jgi:hypothetical protein
MAPTMDHSFAMETRDMAMEEITNKRVRQADELFKTTAMAHPTSQVFIALKCDMHPSNNLNRCPTPNIRVLGLFTSRSAANQLAFYQTPYYERKDVVDNEGLFSAVDSSRLSYKQVWVASQEYNHIYSMRQQIDASSSVSHKRARVSSSWNGPTRTVYVVLQCSMHTMANAPQIQTLGVFHSPQAANQHAHNSYFVSEQDVIDCEYIHGLFHAVQAPGRSYYKVWVEKQSLLS